MDRLITFQKRGQIHSFLKIRTKSQVCGQIHSFLMSVRCWIFPADVHKMLGFLDRTQQRLTIAVSLVRMVGFFDRPTLSLLAVTLSCYFVFFPSEFAGECACFVELLLCYQSFGKKSTKKPPTTHKLDSPAFLAILYKSAILFIFNLLI